MIIRFLQLLRGPKSSQAMVLYIGTVLQLLLGVVTSVVVTRALKPEQYGNYSYVLNLASFVLLIVSTGHFVSISMMLAQSHDDKHTRSLLGTSLLVTLLLSCLFSSIIFFFSFFQDYLFRDKIGYSIRLLALPLFLFPLQTYLESVLMGLNRIHALSAQRAIPKAFYIVALFLYMRFASLGFLSAFCLMLLALYVVYAVQVVNLKPTFDNISANLRHITSENKRYGFHVYVGSLANVATTYLCTLSVSYFGDNTKLGFFNLALTLSIPLGLLPNVVATTFFKSFADMNRVPIKVVSYTLGLSLCSYLVFICLLKKVVFLLYSADYAKSVPLAIILGLGMIIQGLGDVFNRFLCAKARGKQVRNGAFVAGAVNVGAILVLVPAFGGTGAAVTRVLAGSVYFAAMYLYYRDCRMQLTGQCGTRALAV